MEKIYISNKSNRSGTILLMLAFILMMFYPTCVIAREKIRSLKRQKISNIEIKYDKKLIITAGLKVPIGLSVTLDNNNVVTTKGFLNGTVRWNNFEIEALGAYFRNGTIIVPGNSDLVEPDFIIVVIRSKYHDVTARKRIDINYLSRLELHPVETFNKAPGNEFGVGIKKMYDNNTHLFVTDKRKVKKEFENYEVYVKGGRYDAGKFFINRDIFSFKNHQAGITIYHKENPDLLATYEFMLDYRDHFRYIASGSSGSSGMFGYSGSSGSDGSAGQNGQHGSDGQSGNDGSDGYNGPTLEVFADACFDTLLQTVLLKIQVINIDKMKSEYFLVNPERGSITVTSRGGHGGDGGNGGDGGDGGDGGNGVQTEHTITEKYPCQIEVIIEPEEGSDKAPEKKLVNSTCERKIKVVETGPGGDGGWGGYGGNGGNAGYGGNGGDIYVYFSPAMNSYEHLINIFSNPGSGGSGGRGGSAGDGGCGGAGRSSGSTGKPGANGYNGYDGVDGMPGEILYYDWDGQLNF